MTTDEIYGLFCAADYSKLKLLQVLADVAGIDVHELINIIEKKENGTVAQHKNRISAAVRDEECNEVTFSRRVDE